MKIHGWQKNVIKNVHVSKYVTKCHVFNAMGMNAVKQNVMKKCSDEKIWNMWRKCVTICECSTNHKI